MFVNSIISLLFFVVSVCFSVLQIAAGDILNIFLNTSSVNNMVYGSKLVTANFLESIPAGVKEMNRKFEKKKEERDVTKSHEELVEMKETLAIFPKDNEKRLL